MIKFSAVAKYLWPGYTSLPIISLKPQQMKNLTNWIATVATAAAMFFSANAKAQINVESPWRLYFGIESGITTGALHKNPAYSKFELGGTARLQYEVNKNVALTF